MEQEIPKGKTKFISNSISFIVDDRYEYINQLSSGSFDAIVSAIDHQTNTKVAIKKFSNIFQDLIDTKNILWMLKILQFLNHQNIVNLLNIQLPPSRFCYNDIYIVTDLMEVNLCRVIRSGQELTDEHIQYFMYQLLRGVCYIHSANITHRNISPIHILLNRNCDLKISGWGFARSCSEIAENLEEYVGSRWYRAPEMILNSFRNTKSIDIWSCGCIFAEILGRNPVFPGKNYLDQIKVIVKVLGTPTREDIGFISNSAAKRFVESLPQTEKIEWSVLFPTASTDMLDLLDKMLQFSPKKRWAAEQCLAHPYFRDLHESQEILADKHFDASFDNSELTRDQLSNFIYEEALQFHPNI
ncbi:unnamed protein product [Blepharisma stoltei]|uniref:Protein kinase domain-containing protein n=1 Tax=Blepharisma stoltei TaxID=1481888 RepID=A0AAU9K516_9CILI|nr:unnamed protein product [Blepharisma stoltei]